MFGSLGGPELAMIALMLLGSLVVVAFPAGRICVRVGFPIWMGILAVIPLVNVGLLWFVAFTQWPKEPGAPAASESGTA